MIVYMLTSLSFDIKPLDFTEYTLKDLVFLALYICSYHLCFSKWLLCTFNLWNVSGLKLIEVSIYFSMKYETALVNGLIGDLTTVLCFFNDWCFFGIKLNALQLLGCICRRSS